MRSLEDVGKDIREISERIALEEQALAKRIPVKRIRAAISDMKAQRKTLEHELVMIAQSGTESDA